VSPRAALALVAAAAFGWGALLAGPSGERGGRPAAPPGLPELPREARDRCLICHGEALVVEQRLTPDQWKSEVAKMQKFGAPLAPGGAEEAEVLRSLAAVASSDSPPPATLPVDTMPRPPASFADLTAPPAGADAARGAERYAASCAACHGADARGGERGPRLLARPILADAAAFARIVREGLRGMPAAPALDAAATADVLAHLRALTKERSPEAP
jgi:mono/diheme cytochrome c family protein